MKLTKAKLQKLIQEELEQMDEAEMEFDYEKRQFVPGGGDEKPVGGEESDPLRDAVKQFVNAVKDHI